MNHCEDCTMYLKKIVDPETGEITFVEVYATNYAPGNYDADQLSKQVATKTVGESMTNQADAKQADINTIVKNFGLTGQVPVINLPPSIDEFDGIFDFQSAMNVMAQANQAFMRLPAEARSYFNNDPHLFVNFIDEAYGPDTALGERRKRQLEDMGLKLPTPAAPATPAPPGAATDTTKS